MKKKLVLFVIGGIGNQLIQYYSAKKIAEEFSYTLIPIVIGSSKKNSIFAGEGKELFNISDDAIFIPIPLNYQEVIFRKFFNYISSREKVIINSRISVLVHRKTSDIYSAINSRYLFIVDYFLDKNFLELKYILNARKEINIYDRQFNILKSDIMKYRSIGIHVRRGDYSLYSNEIGVLSDEYYIKIIKEIIEENLHDKALRIWVFTQHFSDVQVLIKKVQNIFDIDVMVVSERQLSALQTIYLSTFCHWFIGSNSTFSYWIAVLNSDNSNFLPSSFFKFPKEIMLKKPINTKFVDPIWF